MNNDILQFASEDFSGGEKISNPESWKIIIVDDDKAVHAVTLLALSNFTFKGKSLNILHAYNSEETKKLIVENPDTAVIFLDVVMENHDSGLQLVRFIREKAENHLVRIILRTGQPGYAPELEVITEYDINDYKEKTELTSFKLVTTLITSVKNFDDLRKIEENRQSLAIVASTSAQMHNLDSPTPFRPTIYSSLVKVVNSLNSRLNRDFFLFEGILLEDKIEILGGTGLYENVEETRNSDGLILPSIYDQLKKGSFHQNTIFCENDCAIVLKYNRENLRLIYLKNIPELNEMKRTILRSFSLNIVTVNKNIELMESQKETEKQIRQSLEEKLILVKEIHHRVKNNLQIISSLLHMQTSKIKDKKLLSVLKESEDRVQSMSLVHEKLYQSDLMATIDFSEYIHSLAERLISSYCVHNNITLKIQSDALLLSINTAIPCGLIINEILTNAIKYAFPENRDGVISIILKVADKQIILKISDNGIGLPENLNIEKATSLGMKLIQVLTDQIDGELTSNNNNGTLYTLSFSETEERES